MRSAGTRLTAAVMLAGWVLPLGSPLLCRAAMRDAVGGCEQAMHTPHSAAVAATSSASPCADAALCRVPAPVAPAATGAAPAAAPVEHPATFSVPALRSGAPRAPLPPPPQA